MIPEAHAPSAVFTPPAFLQPFLGTQAIGRNPDRLVDVVQAGLDLTPFWRQGLGITRQAGSTGVIAPGLNTATTIATVPAGRVWIPYQFSANSYGSGAGDQGRARIIVVAPNGSQVITAPGVANNGSTTAISVSLLDYTDRIVFLPAGYVVQGNWDSVVISTAGVAFDWTLTYHELVA